MWSRISNALKPREGNESESDPDNSDARSTADRPPPDPFRANATTYYTQQTPPAPPPGGHSRTASREEDIIWSLRTQLALQRELCAQFEIDLNARDELVQALEIRLDTSEKDNYERKSAIRSWKKKAADLEKLCRHLEDEVDNSRRESMERSVMDAASGDALRQLHLQISQLEREKKDVEQERNSLAQTALSAEKKIMDLQGVLREKNEELANKDYELALKNDMNAEAVLQVEREKREELGRIKTEWDATKTERDMFKTERDTFETERDTFKTERDAFKTERDTFKTERDTFKMERDTFKTERDTFKTERDNFFSEISRLRAYIQQLQRDNATMEVTIVQLNKQLEQGKEDVDGLNIALESKQQELEMVKRTHGVRGSMGPITSRAIIAPSVTGKQVAPSSKSLRASAVIGPRTSLPVSSGAPSALRRVTNAGPPVSSALRRTSSSSGDPKTKTSLISRRLSLASVSSDADEKENISARIASKHSRTTTVPA